jgi:hypothetical protein
MIIESIPDQGLAFGTPAQVCVQPSRHRHLIPLLYVYIPLDNRQLTPLHTSDHHHRLRLIPLNRLHPLQPAFNTHRTNADHRAR